MASKASTPDFSHRPFAGLPGEPDWVALAQVVPAATATAKFNKANGGGDILVTTLLPRIRPAWKTHDSVVAVALQSTFHSGDPGRDVAQAALLAKELEPGTALESIDIDAEGPRLQDILDLDVPFEVSVFGSFDYWEDLTDTPEDFREVIEQAASAIDTTAAVSGVPGAYWTNQNGREFLRWSVGLADAEFFDALARLQAKREAGVVEDARYAGAFRAAGLVIPVWSLPAGTGPDALAEPLVAFRKRFEQALAAKTELTTEERRARAGIVARSVTPR